jgi:hypothetical protein
LPARFPVPDPAGRGKSGINGWTGRDRVFGLCVEVEGVPRKNIEGKLR